MDYGLSPGREGGDLSPPTTGERNATPPGHLSSLISQYLGRELHPKVFLQSLPHLPCYLTFNQNILLFPFSQIQERSNKKKTERLTYFHQRQMEWRFKELGFARNHGASYGVKPGLGPRPPARVCPRDFGHSRAPPPPHPPHSQTTAQSCSPFSLPLPPHRFPCLPPRCGGPGACHL